MLNSETLAYILSFLGADDSVAYCRTTDIPHEAKIVIAASGFFDDGVFGTAASLPRLPLKEWRNIPILFGSPEEARVDGRIILHADIVASAFFLMSRYEETVRMDGRDAYGRFCGRESLPCRAGFIHRPIIDEYRAALRRVLGLPEERKGFSKIWLTHDVDIPWERFTVFTAIKRVWGNLKRRRGFRVYPLKNALGYPESDPLYTFPQILALDGALKKAFGGICQDVYFVISGGCANPQDAPIYIHTKAFERLASKLRGSGALIGYHVSYEAGDYPERIGKEAVEFCKALGMRPVLSRNHFLNAKKPEDFYHLIDAGITDDYTMGYADVAGFRLGTSRGVRWIDPCTGKLTSLTLHPLTIMECSLLFEDYMNLGYADALRYVNKLIEQTLRHGGELSLLWHNQSFVGDSEEQKLYLDIVNELIG